MFPRDGRAKIWPRKRYGRMRLNSRSFGLESNAAFANLLKTERQTPFNRQGEERGRHGRTTRKGSIVISVKRAAKEDLLPLSTIMSYRVIIRRKDGSATDEDFFYPTVDPAILLERLIIEPNASVLQGPTRR